MRSIIAQWMMLSTLEECRYYRSHYKLFVMKSKLYRHSEKDVQRVAAQFLQCLTFLGFYIVRLSWQNNFYAVFAPGIRLSGPVRSPTLYLRPMILMISKFCTLIAIELMMLSYLIKVGQIYTLIKHYVVLNGLNKSYLPHPTGQFILNTVRMGEGRIITLHVHYKLCHQLVD